MHWGDIFVSGARRLTDWTTYAILLAGIVAGGVVPLIWRYTSVNTDSSGVIVLLALSYLWLYLVVVFTWGALTVSSLDGQPLTVSWVFGSTLARFPSFLAASFLLLLVLGATAGVLILLALALSSAESLLGALTPVFLLGGGLVLLLVTYLWRMSFAAVAVDDCGGVEGIRRAWALARTRSGEAVLYLAADTAVAYGLALGVVGTVLIGAQVALGAPAAAVATGLVQDVYTGDLKLPDQGDATAIAFITVSIIVFLLMAFGAVASFSAGSSVGFYNAATQSIAFSPGPEPGGQYCDQCGLPAVSGSAFCDRCGSVFAA